MDKERQKILASISVQTASRRFVFLKWKSCTISREYLPPPRAIYSRYSATSTRINIPFKVLEEKEEEPQPSIQTRTTCHQIKPRLVFQQSLISPFFQFCHRFSTKSFQYFRSSCSWNRTTTTTRKKRKGNNHGGRSPGWKKKKKKK